MGPDLISRDQIFRACFLKYESYMNTYVLIKVQISNRPNSVKYHLKKKKKESRENMSLWADWATQRNPLITSDIQRDSLFHLAISSQSDTEQEIRCLFRMLLRMVLLNTGFTKAEEPNSLIPWSKKRSSSSKWRAISWGRAAIKTLPSRKRAKFQEHKGGDWASIYRGQLWQRKLL